MNRFDRIFATALAGAALTLCVAANSIAANAESAPSAAAVAYSYTLEGTVIETQDDLTLVEDLAGVEWAQEMTMAPGNWLRKRLIILVSAFMVKEDKTYD